MLISTKGRYALRIMLDIAEQRTNEYIPIREVAARQSLSLKYVERIMSALSKGGLVEGIHGKGGGYRLLRKPEEYTVGEVLRLTEGELAPVSCLECDAEACTRASECKTLPMWRKFQKTANGFFDGITLEDLLSNTFQKS